MAGLGITDWSLQDSCGDVEDSVGNAVSPVITGMVPGRYLEHQGVTL